MYQLVCDGYIEGLSYRRLFDYLHRIDFTFSIPMDGNRAEDGIDLRYRFGYENDIRDPIIMAYLDDRPCSVLEMLVALAMRCEEHIMRDPDAGNQTGRWFWIMLNNLGLNQMDDNNFDRHFVDDIVTRWMERKYDSDGNGGLFIIKNSRYDLRSIEIWYQMNWYLNEMV